MGDPYEIFARHILDLRPLDPIDADPGAADYGSFVHQALDRFVDEFPRDLPDDAEARLMAIGREAFGPALHRHGVWAFWWPRFARIARWFLAREHARRPGLVDSATERDGVLDIAAPGGDFRLTARVDRIDRRPDGAIEIVDYKTGAPPADRRVQAGFAPQLPLEAAIAVAGGFENLAAAPVSALSYWRLSGGDPAGKVQAVKGEPATLAADALDGLRALVAAFDDPATPYRAQPVPEMAPTHGDYLHLARVREWSLTGGEDGE
jgi:ATP-dependent helicase/nuclease subunit B